MILVANPSITELEAFIDQVQSFPVTAGQLVNKAMADNHATDIIDFYKSFAPDRLFDDKEDLAASSELVEMVRQEEPLMPPEEQTAPEDD